MLNVRCLNSLMLCCALGASPLVPANAQSSLGAQAGVQTSVENKAAAPVTSGVMREHPVTNTGFCALSSRFEEVDQQKTNSQYLESNSDVEQYVLSGSGRAGGLDLPLSQDWRKDHGACSARILRRGRHVGRPGEPPR
jgi:hypothetical protein